MILSVATALLLRNIAAYIFDPRTSSEQIEFMDINEKGDPVTELTDLGMQHNYTVTLTGYLLFMSAERMKFDWL